MDRPVRDLLQSKEAVGLGEAASVPEAKDDVRLMAEGAGRAPRDREADGPESARVGASPIHQLLSGREYDANPDRQRQMKGRLDCDAVPVPHAQSVPHRDA